MAKLFSLFCCTYLVILQASELVHASAFDNTVRKGDQCRACEPEKCPSVGSCALGIVKDRCGCCDVCGLEEFQLCNLPQDWIPMAMGEMAGSWHGRCGEGLECRLRKDVDPKFIEEKQAICYCKKVGVVCASDGNTYSQCKMDANSRISNGTIRMISEGPCKSEPKILSLSKSKEIVEGERLTLVCEVQGYPMPTVSWYFNRQGRMHENVKLPGDSEEISVSLRGGPQITRLTSHLQVGKVDIKHEGTYQCMTENDLGMQTGSLSLTVLPSGSSANKWNNNADSGAHWFQHDEWGSDEM